MPWYAPVSVSQTGTVVTMASGDGLLVAENVMIASSESYTIVGWGSNNQLLIHGTVAGTYAGNSVVSMGDQAAFDSGNSVEIGASGHIYGLDSSVAVAMTGFNNSLVNHGTITSLDSAGISIRGTHAITQSTITNNGHIEGVIAIARNSIDANAEKIVLTNNGIMEGTQACYGWSSVYPYATGIDLITNNGKMIGDVWLSNGNDLYEGRNGSVAGIVDGGSGNDTIYGGAESNVLMGGDGLDMIAGGGGADLLTGGLGADQFVFFRANESRSSATRRDTIDDFSTSLGDLINLKSIDANNHRGGNQAFDFIGKAAFSGDEGDLRYVVKSGDTYLFGDINGDRKADFSIKLEGIVALTDGDFIL